MQQFECVHYAQQCIVAFTAANVAGILLTHRTGATRGRINCGSTILITINTKNTNKTKYKRPQWCGAKSSTRFAKITMI